MRKQRNIRIGALKHTETNPSAITKRPQKDINKKQPEARQKEIQQNNLQKPLHRPSEIKVFW